MNIILGAGIIGLFIGYRLLKKGEKVKIFDAKDLTVAASKASVGMLAPMIEAKPKESELLELMINSKKIWDKKYNNEEFKKIGLKKNSSLLIAENIDDMERLKFKRKFFDELGFKSEFLNKKQTEEIEPELNSNFLGSLFCENQNQVDPIVLRKFLISQIHLLGGKIVNIKSIKKIKIKKNFIELDGKKIKARKIIIACGAWSGELINRSFNLLFPIRPIKGISMLVDAGRELFKNNLWFRNIYIAQRENNILSIGATEQERGFDENIRMDEVYYLTKNIWESFVDLESMKLIDIKCGIRPGVIDGYPIIGTLDKISEDLICAFGHYRHGLLLAPITADIVSDYVLEKKIDDKTKFFSPQRFNL